MLAAAEELTERGLARIILLGDPEPVNAEARRLGIDISKVGLSRSHRVPYPEALSVHLSPRPWCELSCNAKMVLP